MRRRLVLLAQGQDCPRNPPPISEEVMMSSGCRYAAVMNLGSRFLGRTSVPPGFGLWSRSASLAFPGVYK
jgi:hypothetical protein